MIFTPENYKLWDCWILRHEGKYYLFHLALKKERLGKGGWDGINLALSDDLIHWEEYGRVLDKSPDAEWIGTGTVQKIGDRFIMNFSEEKPAGRQRVYFAESRDLLHWERLPEVCRPDGVYYMDGAERIANCIPRWDSIGVVDAMEDNGPPYYGFVTSNTLQYELPNKSGSLGLVTSEDGLNWKCLPNAFPDTSAFPQFEVPEHFEINGRHYVTFCTSSYLGFRFDDLSEDMSGGTFYVVSDSLTGPYRKPEADCMLQGTRNNEKVSIVTVGRPLIIDGKIYYYHIWGDNGPDGWVGTVKLLDEEKPYKLRLLYNPVNDKMKGRLLADGGILRSLAQVNRIGGTPSVGLVAGGGLKFVGTGPAGAFDAQSLNGSVGGKISDLSDGRILSFSLTLNGGEGAGAYFKTKDGRRIGFMLNKKRGRLEFGEIKNGWAGNSVFIGDLYQKCAAAETSNVLLFVRREFFEVYVNGSYVSSWRSGADIDPNAFGMYFEDSDGEMSDLKIYQMK